MFFVILLQLCLYQSFSSHIVLPQKCQESLTNASKRYFEEGVIFEAWWSASEHVCAIVYRCKTMFFASSGNSSWETG